MKIENINNDAALYLRYPSQAQRQDALLCLDVERAHLWAQVDPEVGGAVPARVWHGVIVQWGIPPLRVEALARLMAQVEALAEVVVAHSEIEWDGHNHVRLTADVGESALDAISALVESEPWSEHDVYDPWEAEDWFAGRGTTLADMADMGLSATSTDEDLAEAAAALVAEAAESGATLIAEDVARVLGSWRETAQEEAAAISADRWVMAIDDGGGEEEIDAEDVEEALKQARDWAREGDYGEIESTIWIDGWVAPADDPEDRTSFTVVIDPEEPACERSEGHEWITPHEVVGGLESNPGVWGHGGGAKGIEVCRWCGCGKHWNTWAQRPDTGEQGLDSIRFAPGEYEEGMAAIRRRWARDWAEREADALDDQGVDPSDWPEEVRPDAAIGAGATLDELQAAWDEALAEARCA